MKQRISGFGNFFIPIFRIMSGIIFSTVSNFEVLSKTLIQAIYFNVAPVSVSLFFLFIWNLKQNDNHSESVETKICPLSQIDHIVNLVFLFFASLHIIFVMDDWESKTTFKNWDFDAYFCCFLMWCVFRTQIKKGGTKKLINSKRKLLPLRKSQQKYFQDTKKRIVDEHLVTDFWAWLFESRLIVISD